MPLSQPILVLLAAAPACSWAEPPTDRAPPTDLATPTDQARVAPRFRLGGELEVDGRRGASGYPFDLVVVDMDRDGDEDLLASRHFFGLQLYESRDGALHLLNSGHSDQAGLDLPPGVRTTYAAGAHQAGVEGPAVVAWNLRTGAGELVVVLRGAGRRGPDTLRVAAHEPFEVTQGDPGSWVQRSDREIDVPFPPRGEERELRLRPKERTPRWSLSQLDARGAAAARAVPYYLGGDLDRFDQAALSWWSDDPHGMAWAQLTGGPEPELVVVRGGNLGQLQEGGLDKESALYAWNGAPQARYQRVAGAIPPDGRRGRAAEWVDIDLDGRNELYLSNRDGPPALLVWRDEAGRFIERTDTHSLGEVCSEIGAWLDLGEDGWQDLVLVCDQGLQVARNVAVGAFVLEDGARLGLSLPDLGAPPRNWLREDLVQVLDVDGDDRLDLWLAGLGQHREHRIFLGQADGTFRDATAALGLAGAGGVVDLRPVDADMDGYVDALVRDEGAALLWNRGAAGFERVPLAALVDDLGGVDPDKAVGVGLEVDGDGRTDLVVGGGAWRVLRNDTPGPARALQVVIDAGSQAPPIGTLLRATYADGHVQRVRYGSHARSALSQSLPPVTFGVPAPGALLRLEVRWPGAAAWTEVPVPAEAAQVVVAAPPLPR